MQDGAAGLLADAGFEAYEVSAWTRGGRESRHNLNYWRFGDYLGIGAGAHGKITGAPGGYVRRRSKNRHPRRFLAGERLAEDRVLSREDLRFEFFLNALRLRGGFDQSLFEERTGLPWREAEPVVLMARERGLLEACPEGFRPSELGWRFMNDLQALFLPGRKTAGA
jgi:oxygen-independent coproporphyrinogen-3 oxidase